VAESNTSFDKFNQAIMATEDRHRARVFKGKKAPVWTNAAVALTRTGARPTEYIGSLIARFHRALLSSLSSGALLTISPSGPIIPSGLIGPSEAPE